MCEETRQSFKVERLPIRQSNGKAARYDGIVAVTTQLARCAPVGLAKRIVETTRAAKTGGDCDFRHRQAGLVDESFGKLQTLCVRDGEWARAQMLYKQTPQVPAANAKSGSKRFDTLVFERAVCDQLQSALYRCRSPRPGWCARGTLGTATQTGPVTRLAGRGGRLEERDVLAFWHVGRANRAAVDTGRAHTDEETPVETGVP